jgi:hypothetical protein
MTGGRVRARRESSRRQIFSHRHSLDTNSGSHDQAGVCGECVSVLGAGFLVWLAQTWSDSRPPLWEWSRHLFLHPWSYLRAPIDNMASGNVPDDLAARAGRRSSNVGLSGATACVAGVLTVSPHQDGLTGRVALSGMEQLGASARLGHFTNGNGVRTGNRGREISNRAG